MKKTSIYVKTLGGFEIRCNDKRVMLGRNKGSKYIQLVSRVCSAGEDGVSKENLQEDIYSDDVNEKSNLNNSLNNLIYQFKKIAEKAGIPGGKIIAVSGGNYVVDPSVDVTTDAVLFKSLIIEGKSNAEKKTELYQKAFDLYKGDFLPELDELYWISKSAVEYRAMYEECVDYLSEEYRKAGKYKDMAHIFHTAASIDKDCEWQVGEIDALRMQGNYKKAFSLYEEMVRYYAEELGISPTEHMQNCYQELQDAAASAGDADGKSFKEDSPLSEELSVEEDNKPYECLFPEMSASYHILSRNMERHGLSVFLLLLTIADYEGKEIKQ